MKIEIGDIVSFKKVVKGNYTISENVSKILDDCCVVKNVSNEKILISSENIWIPKSFVEKIINKHLTNKEKKRIEELKSEFNSELEKYKVFKLKNFLDKCGAIFVCISFVTFVLSICFNIWQLTFLCFGIFSIFIIGFISILKMVDNKYTKLRTKAKETLTTKEEYGRLKAYLNF